MYFHPNHPPCPGRCGELADECNCRNIRAAAPAPAPAPAQEPADWYDDDFAAPCRWRNCTADAETRGFCDAHYGTL